MSPALNGSTALQRFEHNNAVDIRNGIMFDFYPGLPHVYTIHSSIAVGSLERIDIRTPPRSLKIRTFSIEEQQEQEAASGTHDRRVSDRDSMYFRTSCFS